MKKKNGFTLIELLAVIVILAIIALIAVPIVLNLIERSRKGAAIDSAYGYKEAINEHYLSELIDNPNYILNGKYKVGSNGILINTQNEEESYNIEVSGSKPSNGEVTFVNNVMTEACLIISGYKVTLEDGKFISSGKGECDGTSIGDGNIQEDNPYEFVRENSGDIQIGEEIIFGTEHFYVVSASDSKVVLLAKYNLYVGNRFDSDLASPINPDEEGYGLQNEIARGCVFEYGYEVPIIGTVPFSTTICGYNEEYDEKPQGSIETPTNEKYSIAYYVKEYVNKLKKMGAPSSITGRLLLLSDIEQYNCDFAGNPCESAPAWLYSVSYWLGSGENGDVNIILDENRLGGNCETYPIDDYESGGVRPVIEINLSDIKTLSD